MPSVKQDIQYLQNAVENLEPFLLSKDIYWPISGLIGPGTSQLSLGMLLLALKRVQTVEKSPQQAMMVESLRSRISSLRDRWKTHWDQKAAKEFPARTTLWRSYLKDYQEDAYRSANEYSQRVEWRVILDLLAAETEDIPRDSQLSIKEADQQLRSFFKPGPFIWEGPLEPGFPPEPFWYLYGKLPGNGSVN